MIHKPDTTFSVRIAAILFFLILANSSLAWTAEEESSVHEVRHGLVVPEQVLSFEGGITAVGQDTNDSRLDSTIEGSIDMVVTIPAPRGEFTLYVEGSTSITSDDIPAVIWEANGDAGSALSSNDHGRFQVSELHYTLPWERHQLTAGLIDVTAFLDTSEVANDETSQFLSATLVNNPTIEFPDYTLGAVLTGTITQEIGYTIAMTGSHGLADNPSRSYEALCDLNAEGKGVFTAAELNLTHEPVSWRLGVWLTNADHPELDGSSMNEENYGVYGVLDLPVGNGQLGIRAGLANSEVSEAAAFVSTAVEYPLGPAHLGLGASLTTLAGDAEAPGRDDTIQMEIFSRFDIANGLHITPSVQWIKNSGFDSSDSLYKDDLMVFSLRTTYSFEI